MLLSRPKFFAIFFLFLAENNFLSYFSLLDLSSTISISQRKISSYLILCYYLSMNFEEKTLDVIDFSEADTTADHYAHLVEMNKAVTTTINGLLKIYSSRLALNTYSNYSAYDFSTPEEDEEAEE